MDQTEDLDAVLVPIGGGGLITGIATVIKKLKPEILVYVSCKYGFSLLFNSLLLKKETISSVIYISFRYNNFKEKAKINTA